MHVGSTSGGGRASVQSPVSYALVRRSSLRTPRNFMHAQKFSAYADVRPVRSEHAMHTLCERSARPQHGRHVCVFSAYAYRIKIDSALVSIFIARSHRMQNERVAYA